MQAVHSLVTVTKNNLAGLQKTLSSLGGQGKGEFEWIVVDGASSDGTGAFLETLVGAHALGFPFQFLSEPDLGIYDAMNKGLARARGAYILFLNAGDRLAGPDVLSTVRAAAQRAPYDIVYGDAWEDRQGLGPVLKPARSHRQIARGLFTHHQAIFYHRRALERLSYDLRYRIAADYDLTARVLARKGTALYVPVPVCVFEPGGVSQRAVRRGRAEQFHIRERLGLASLPVNTLIYGLQAASSALRAAAPGLYWALRRRRIWRAMAR
jgi:putative colanic acid biosynthesis glycosyltransferase